MALNTPLLSTPRLTSCCLTVISRLSLYAIGAIPIDGLPMWFTYDAQKPLDDYEMVRAPGIEPGTPAWKAGVLPLNYARVFEASTF